MDRSIIWFAFGRNVSAAAADGTSIETAQDGVAGCADLLPAKSRIRMKQPNGV
ncbi:hypothetical protein [Paraburkholderia youngii]|uniref:Uncharacterized protein n=1 Tax=Paraburkholderia youngii TaxID=2782701 RepID=A0A7W8LDV4_9BURK|nr:hypothetical protein [Paraburkholderia youngii]MBB5405214.1 hypothetical protein [Paraburkholderia youngii]